MLITHVKPNEVLGKRVYDREGWLLGHVVGITGRHGIVRAMLLRDKGKVVRLPQSEPNLRVLH